MTKLPLIQLPSNPSCQACELHEGMPEPRCVPTTWLERSRPPGSGRPKLLLVGMNPGREEMKAHAPFVGLSGACLRNVYLRGSVLLESAEIWLTNSARCWTPLTAQPSPKQRLTCTRLFTVPDLELLTAGPPTDLHIVALGGDAAQTLLALFHPKPPKPKKGEPKTEHPVKFTLSWLLRHQGTPVLLPGPPGSAPRMARLWGTYHPSYLLRTNGAQAPAVDSHIRLISSAVLGMAPSPSKPSFAEAGPPP